MGALSWAKSGMGMDSRFLACYTGPRMVHPAGWQGFQQLTGIIFRDPSLLQQSLRHSSFINENPTPPLSSNERLEFLGDAIINFIVAEKLYHEFPDLLEGKLTEIRVSLIRQETLAQLAAELNLGDYLLLGKGEESSGGRQRETSLADAFEALVGAICLDQGLEVAGDFVLSRLDRHLRSIKTGEAAVNYKTRLQELTQARYKQLPNYRIVEAAGPAHDKEFTVEVALGEQILAGGSGKSKRAAEMEAARSAWEKLTGSDAFSIENR